MAGGSTSTEAIPVAVHELEGETELRLETAATPLIITLVSGSAELFGTELAISRPYTFDGPQVSLALFTWNRALIEVKGKPAVVYTSKETTMVEYVNLHAKIEALRKIAIAANQSGPRVMVIGNSDSGKSTLCRTLVSYAVRAGRRVVFADLDVARNDITIPGCVSATPVLHPISIEYGLVSPVPAVFFYGSTSPADNVDHYKTCVTELAKAVDKRMAAHDDERYAGLIINTCGWTDGDGYSQLVDAAHQFGVNVIVVIGQDRLHAQLSQEPALQAADTIITKVAKSGGVVTAGGITSKRRQLQRRIRSYFYGEEGDLNPHTTHIRWSDVGIYEVGGLAQVPSTMLPIGEERLLQANQVMPVTPTNEFLHSILAISQAKTPEDLLTAPIVGFVFVASIDLQKHSMSVLTPCPGPLPAQCLVHGSLKWLDQ